MNITDNVSYLYSLCITSLLFPIYNYKKFGKYPYEKIREFGGKRETNKKFAKRLKEKMKSLHESKRNDDSIAYGNSESSNRATDGLKILHTLSEVVNTHIANCY